ncbi:SPW repeat domain-containing protein [Amycolatopsis rhizosphaerae]|uniref:SPW repeat domain-containing protein n=1 Tax=Amycolatopsis rhizosphaerae TaxID=2053003 RepID=UPI001FE5B1C5|nr:SPW repeat protein [Amycolatopsis rhizosphaerae]
MTRTSTASTIPLRPWARPHDWVEITLGVLAALSFLWVAATPRAQWTMVAFGTLIALDGLLSAVLPRFAYSEGVQVVLGTLLFASPWVMTYTGLAGASWWSWVLGGLTILVASLAVPIANAAAEAPR